MPGIIEVNATEYYHNPQEDSEGIVNNLILTPLGNEDGSMIHGDVSIRPKKQYMYLADTEITNWKVKEEKTPVKLSVIDKDTVVV